MPLPVKLHGLENGNLKKNLEISYDYSDSAAFRTIDRFNMGVLNVLNIDEFFKEDTLPSYLFDEENRSVLFSLKRRISKVICNAVGCLHRQDPPIAHGDIHPCNILVMCNGVVKLCDVAFSSYRQKAENSMFTQFGRGRNIGTLGERYQPPEVIYGNIRTFVDHIWLYIKDVRYPLRCDIDIAHCSAV